MYSSDKGKQIDSAVLFNNSVGKPSGPGALPPIKLFSLDETNCGVITSVSMIEGELSVSGGGINDLLM